MSSVSVDHPGASGERRTAPERLRWVVVRPDTLREGEVSAYSLHERPVSSLFRPDDTRTSNVADFICDLAADDGSWGEWAGRLPVIVDRT